jgi:CDGSH-type Zn-finger protein
VSERALAHFSHRFVVTHPSDAKGADVTKINVRPNGPLIVEGDFTLVDENGNEVVPKKKALCRCGGSTTKPYCDGTHSKIGFRGANEAVREAEEE